MDTTTKKSGWCLPVIIYFVLAILSLLTIVLSKKENKASIFVINLIFYIAYGGLMFWLCKNNNVGWAWLLLFLPFIILIILILTMLFGFAIISSSQ